MQDMKKHETPDADFLLPKEVAKTLRLSTRSVRDRVITGKLPGTRLGKTIRIPRAAFDAFMARNTVTA
jgi:excisionase family DNA binding protein